MLKELFRVGKWNGKTYTLNDLESIVENSFNSKVPVTLGHDFLWRMDDIPAYGISEKTLKVENNSLNGALNLNAEGKEAVNSGKYPNLSVGIGTNQDLVTDTNSGKFLHHIALLGAYAPAIGDLKTYKKESNLEIFSINGETNNIEILTFTQGESNVKTEDKTVVEPTVKTVDFSTSPEYLKIKAENEAFKKSLDAIKLARENEAKDNFRDSYSKMFKTEALDELLTNKLVNSEILGIFKALLNDKLEVLPTEDFKANTPKDDDVFDCGYKGDK